MVSQNKFLNILYFFKLIYNEIYFLDDITNAVPVDIGISVNPNPSTDNVKEVEVVAMRANVSADFNRVVNAL